MWTSAFQSCWHQLEWCKVPLVFGEVPVNTQPVWLSPYSGDINVWNIFNWRAGSWWLSRVEFLLFVRGCQLGVWRNVAEYLECRAINRWDEHAKGANVNNPPSHTWCAASCCPAAVSIHRAHCLPSKLLRVLAAAGEENSKKSAQSSHLLSPLTRLRVHVCICKERAEGLKITSSGKHHQAGEQSPAPLFMHWGCESMQAL